MAEAYIVESIRTPGGRRKGALSGWHPADMAGEVLNALVDRTGIDPASIDDVIMGCVTKAGEQGFNIGRNAVLASRLPDTVPAVTVDRQCGSSQQALHFAAQAVMAGVQDVVIAAGVESMTRVPMFADMTVLAKAGIGEGPVSARIRERYGVSEFNQFNGAEMVAQKYGLSRDMLDAYALDSHRRAAGATESGAFERETLPLQVDGGTHSRDEGIRFDATAESIGGVDLLIEGGVLSAANASQICDGASGALIVSERALKAHGLTPLARVVDMTVTAGDPVIMLEEPITATNRALEKSGLKLDEIDLFEVNEAFASIPLAWLKQTGADPERTNVNGGAIALGHPLGASGTRLLSTLIHALKARGGKYGLQTMCEGGGTANVTIVEAL
ncbi:acetyl-CoA C-acetyltransferase [Lutimaribacter pacificus]|uniref:Acetyl-CoA C-acetyltransferase n=1 Tax=Lutimaribacter pacificus TaxID=391948 RepID=A0A1H0EMQ6_9RHOB|nr:acetyl-CoA C-acetyltransferase [Lutimaribacter pacificus]SDN83606.1 acetyl-CoA C-acetyltransferase [Lutimaribacter pacificus]SHK51211.1 acetyl-CoA C-acetyltransferase [Lutimaribacter pacificus]